MMQSWISRASEASVVCEADRQELSYVEGFLAWNSESFKGRKEGPL